MAQPQHSSSLTSLEEAVTVLFCLIDEAYTTFNPRGAYRYETLNLNGRGLSYDSRRADPCRTWVCRSDFHGPSARCASHCMSLNTDFTINAR